jgi:CBS domain-containing protein
MLDAASIMTRKVFTVRPEHTVAHVAELLAQKGISAAPVCDEAGNLLGMVSENDLMRPFVSTNVKRRTWWLELLADGNDLAPEFLEYVRLDRHLVGDLMSKGVVTATEGSSISELADLFVQHHIKRVPIVRDGKLVGIVSRADVIRAIARAPGEVVAPL